MPASDEAAVAAIRRSNQALFELTATRISSGYADLFVNRELAGSIDCNIATDVLLDGDGAIETIEHAFQEHGLLCQRWLPAAAQDVDALGAGLAIYGAIRTTVTAFRFGRSAAHAQPDSGSTAVQVLEARAMRRAFTAIAEASSAADPNRQPLLLERLNSPQYTAFVATIDGTPAGAAALFQSGEIGRLCDVFVVPALRRRGVGTALVARIVATAQRWAIPSLVASARADNAAVRAFFARTGFASAGTMFEFVRPDEPRRTG